MEEFDSFQNRPEYFANVNLEQWQDWIWQQQNAVRNSMQLKKVFPDFAEEQLKLGQEWQKRGFRFLITPYVLSLVRRDSSGNPLKDDPVWRQVFPVFDELLKQTGAPDEYSAANENWEMPQEMISPIAQHKYPNRVIIYVADTCLGYCLYCFRSLQSGADSEKHGGRPYFKDSLRQISARPEVEEVILSGGDPLIFDNANIEQMLKEIREIKHVKAIRIHTRAWTHNPYRIDQEFCGLLKKYAVTEMGVHCIHPNELTKDFQDAVSRVRASGARTLLCCDTPLIKGVNDDAEILHELFMELYTSGVKPYYFSHNMPNIPAARSQRTSVRRGLELYNKLKRRISNPAMPEYIITHQGGKKTIPESPEGTPDFVYGKNKNGHPIVRFLNFKGEWQEYLDGLD
jgi:lysine 2,3-aminomutase